MLALLAVGPAAFGQSAANFQTPEAAAPATSPEAPAHAPAVAQQHVLPPPADLPASRNVSELDRPAYLKAISESFAIRAQIMDPFCIYQDPNARPVVKVSLPGTRTRTPVKITPFADIVKRLKVTAVMPRENAFLVGTRSIRVNDTLPIKYRENTYERTYKVEVVEVTSSRIKFKNIENGETGDLELDVLPPGMTRGLDQLTFPGIAPGQNDPLSIDSAVPGTE